MTEPQIPSDPAAMKAWLEGQQTDDLKDLVQGLAGAPAQVFADLDTGNPPIELPVPPDEPSMLTLTIELTGIKPRIWRRLALRGDLTLDAVHTLFQAAMGWSDSHLHRFELGVGRGREQRYFLTEFDEEEGDEGTREHDARLDQVLRARGDRLTYRYDFGDDWEHRVTLESVAPLGPDDAGEPSCLGGAKACPPEDVGGIYGYSDIAHWLRSGASANEVPPIFEDAEQARDWLPSGYDPDAFDADEATGAMRSFASGEPPWQGLPDPLADLVQVLRGQGWVQALAWLAALGPREAVRLDDDEVRGAAMPWLAVLHAVGSGTKLTAAGYLTPALVERIAVETGIPGSWAGATHREEVVWPVAILRESAQGVGLVRKAKGTLTPTARARAAADNPRNLVASVVGRLPVGKGFETQAGWASLLGLAAGATGDDLHEGVAEILTDRGWCVNGRDGVSARDARRGSRSTLIVLDFMAGGVATPDDEVVARLARAALFGVVAPR